MSQQAKICVSVYVKNVSRTIITIPLIVIRFVLTVIFYCNTHYCLNFTKKFGQPHFLHLSPSPPSHVKKGWDRFMEAVFGLL